jgi:hypothetical protein
MKEIVYTFENKENGEVIVSNEGTLEFYFNIDIKKLKKELNKKTTKEVIKYIFDYKNYNNYKSQLNNYQLKSIKKIKIKNNMIDFKTFDKFSDCDCVPTKECCYETFYRFRHRKTFKMIDIHKNDIEQFFNEKLGFDYDFEGIEANYDIENYDELIETIFYQHYCDFKLVGIIKIYKDKEYLEYLKN